MKARLARHERREQADAVIDPETQALIEKALSVMGRVQAYFDSDYRERLSQLMTTMDNLQAAVTHVGEEAQAAADRVAADLQVARDQIAALQQQLQGFIDSGVTPGGLQDIINQLGQVDAKIEGIDPAALPPAPQPVEPAPVEPAPVEPTV